MLIVRGPEHEASKTPRIYACYDAGVRSSTATCNEVVRKYEGVEKDRFCCSKIHFNVAATRQVATARTTAKKRNTPLPPRASNRGRKAIPTHPFTIQLRPKPREPKAAALLGGTTSGIRMKGIGPKPMEKDETKERMAMLERTGERPMVSARRNEESAMNVVEARSKGFLPRCCPCEAWSARDLRRARTLNLEYCTHIDKVHRWKGLKEGCIESAPATLGGAVRGEPVEPHHD